MRDVRYSGDKEHTRIKRTKNLQKTIMFSSVVFMLILGSTGIHLAPAAYAATTNTLTIMAYSTGGDALRMYTEVMSEGRMVKTGYTPLTYTGIASATYTVKVHDYMDRTFSHWGNKSTDSSRTITLSGDTTAVAYYVTGKTRYLTVNAYTTDGRPLSMYAEVRSGSAIVKSGYTPFTYAGGRDKTYAVTISSYQDRVFSFWGGGSGSSNPRTLTLWGDRTATAYYTTAKSSDISSLIPETGVFVALYMYPGPKGSVHWQKLTDEKREHPSVPVVAAFNPSSGPGLERNSNIAYWVDRLQDAGIIAIGYVPDGYGDTKNPGARDMAYMRDAIKKYRDWYGADGIFIDEMTNKPGYERRYAELTAYAKSLGMKMTLGNAGTDVPPSYIGTVDVINVSEGSGYTSVRDSNLLGVLDIGGYLGWHEDYDKSNFAFIRYDIDSLDVYYVREVSKWVGLIYITDGDDTNSRWFNVPPYLGSLLDALD